MAKIIGVRFRNNGKVYYFDPGRYIIKEGAGVIVETSQGVEYADVVIGTREVSDAEIVAPLKGIMRVATPKDAEQAQQNRQKEQEALTLAEEKIKAHNLDMKLVRVEYTFDGAKIVFYFTSEGRVDFRELVKDLASAFRTRIELRQIGARDEAKMLGGLGPCGLPCCCNQFLSDFQPVSIKMAKEQGLSLNPTKISGLCGRLMCCLKYEQSHYEETRKLLPKIGTDVRCRDGVGKVCELNMLRERVKVKLSLPGDAIDIREYYYKELTPLQPEQKSGAAQEYSPEAPADAFDAPSSRDESAPGASSSEKPAEGKAAAETAGKSRPPQVRRPEKQPGAANGQGGENPHGERNNAGKQRGRHRGRRPDRGEGAPGQNPPASEPRNTGKTPAASEPRNTGKTPAAAEPRNTGNPPAAAEPRNTGKPSAAAEPRNTGKTPAAPEPRNGGAGNTPPAAHNHTEQNSK